MKLVAVLEIYMYVYIVIDLLKFIINYGHFGMYTPTCTIIVLS